MAENGGAAARAPAPAVPYMCRDIVYEIMLRLPPADIHRSCRNVCPEWRELVAEGYFIATHRRLRSPMPLFFYRRDFTLGPVNPGENPGIARVDLHAVDLAARESRPVLCFADFPDPVGFNYLDPTEDADDLGDELGLEESDPNTDGPIVDPEDMLLAVEGSCDGILLFSFIDRLYVCNPCTRHWALLPPIHLDHGIVAFYARGPHGDGREYRVLYRRKPFDPTYWIRVLGAPEQDAVTPIGRRTSPAMPRALALESVLYSWLPTIQAPIMVHGNLHWLPTYLMGKLLNYKMVVFDTDVEEFRLISSPPALTDPKSKIDIHFFEINALQLLEIEGMLAMAIINGRPGSMVHVWVLHDYVNEAWAQMYKIELLAPEITADNGYDPFRHSPL